MEMEHRLRRARPVRLDEVKSVRPQRRVHRLRDFDGGARGASEGFRRHLEHRRVVHLRDDETMPIMHGVDVHEGERIAVLIKLEARDLARDDLAEDAIRIGCHGAPRISDARSLAEPGIPAKLRPALRYSAAMACGAGAERKAASSSCCRARAAVSFACLMWPYPRICSGMPASSTPSAWFSGDRPPLSSSSS